MPTITFEDSYELQLRDTVRRSADGIMNRSRSQSLWGSVRELFYDRILPMYEHLSSRDVLERGLGRVTFYLGLLDQEGVLRPTGRVVDLGCGLSYFPPLLRYLGPEVTVVDDFGGGGLVQRGAEHITEETLARFKSSGIVVVRQDLLSNALPMPDESVDAVTCFHSLEHWHHSPRRLFGEITRVLKPGGVLVIGTPNSVNLRKRLWVLFGKTNLATLEEWYHDGEPFRGHVREPTVGELKKLMEWNGFQVRSLKGRNFIGRESVVVAASRPALRNAFAGVVSRLDWLLRLRASWCSDIHVVARKPDKRLG